MKNDLDLILAYYELVGRMEAILKHNLYDSIGEYENLLKNALKKFKKAEGKKVKRLPI